MSIYLLKYGAPLWALVILAELTHADDGMPTAYEVMNELRQAAINECAANGPSCEAFTDIQRQLGRYIEATCRSHGLTSDECARSPIHALLNAPTPPDDLPTAADSH